MRKVLAALFIVLGCGQSMGARGLPGLPLGVRIMDSEEVYEVSGTTVEEIRASLREGSRDALAGESLGRHQWNIRWNWRTLQVNSGCEVTEVTVDLESNIVLPRWMDREKADPAIVAAWDTFIIALRNHEFCHRVLAYRGAREISRRIGALESTTCGSVSAQARLVGQGIIDKHNELNAQYDRDSRGYITWGQDIEASEPPQCPFWR